MDNLFTERHWRTVKYEEIYFNDCLTPEEARRGLSHHLMFNCDRRSRQLFEYRTTTEVYFETQQQDN